MHHRRLRKVLPSASAFASGRCSINRQPSTHHDDPDLIRQRKPVDMIIFGGGGDLSARKLLPALYMAHLHCNLPAETRIIAIGRKDWSRDEYLDVHGSSSRSRSSTRRRSIPRRGTNSSRCSTTCASTSIPPTTSSAWRETSRPNALRVFYLATAPDLFTTICDNLTNAGLVDEHSRVVLEKPLGHDLASAQAINDVGRQAFQGSADLPHRPLPRQGNGAEPDGAALRQRDLRAAVAGAVYQERADHGGGNGRRRQPRGLLRPDRRAARHGAEPLAATAVHRRDGAAGVARLPTPCATKS